MTPSLFDDLPDASHAHALGEIAGAACEQSAERRGWDSAAAAAFILDWLATHGPTSGETLVSAASKLYPPHDGRAFGPVFLRLSRRKLIESCGYTRRVKGHGTHGGLVWRLKEANRE